MSTSWVYLLETKPFDPVSSTTKNVFFASNLEDDAALGQSTPYMLRLKQAYTHETSVFQDNLPGGTQISVGSSTLANADGELDFLLDYSWDGRSVVVKKGLKGQPYSSFITEFAGSSLELTAATGELVLTIRDNSYKLAVPIQNNKYLGSGGKEGGADLKDTRKPLCYGPVRNLAPVAVDDVRLVYQIHDGPIVSVDAVYDRAVPLTLYGNYGSYSTLLAVSVPPGYYATCVAEGFLKLGAPTVGTLTTDVHGQYSSSTTIGALAKAILMGKVGLTSDDLYEGSFDQLAVDAPYSYEGVYIPGSDSQADEILETLVSSVDSFWFLDKSGRINVRRFKFRTPVAAVRAEDVAGLQRQSSPYPLYKVVTNYSKNPTVLSSDEFTLPRELLNGYLLDSKVFVATASDGSGGSYTYEGEFLVFLNTTQINDLDVVTFAKKGTADWLTLGPNGRFTVSDPGADSASVTLIANLGEYFLEQTFTLVKSKGASPKNLTLSSDRRRFYYSSDGTPDPAVQTATITATPTNVSGLTFTAYDNLGNTVSLSGSGNSRTFTLLNLTDSVMVRWVDVTVAATGGTSNSLRILVTHGEDGVAAGTLLAIREAQNAIEAVESGGSADTTPPAKVIGLALSNALQIQADGSYAAFLKVSWSAVSDSDLDGYDVYIKSGSENYSSVRVDKSSLFYLYPAVSSVTYKVKVRAVDKAGNQGTFSDEATIVMGADITPPGLVSGLTVTPSFQTFHLSWTCPADADLASVEIWESTTSSLVGASMVGTMLANPGSSGGFVRSGLDTGSTRYYWVRSVDSSGNKSGYGTVVGPTTLLLIEDLDFTPGLSPVKSYSTLPNPVGYTGSPVVFNTTDRKLYRYDPTVPKWTVEVPSSDLSGTISTAQIAANAINSSKFATDIKPIEIVASLPTSGNTAGRVVYLTTDSKLYRYNGTSWTAAVPTGDLTGTVSGSQIADLAISAAKVADSAITTDKIANAAVAAGKIAAAAVGAAQLADAIISNAKLANGLAAVESVASLPSTGNFQGRTVMLQSDGKLYRWNSTAPTGTASWTAAVPTSDLSGTVIGSQISDSAITASKISDGAVSTAKILDSAISNTKLADNAVVASKIADSAISNAKLASGLAAVESVASLPSTGNFQGRTVMLQSDGKLYRWNSTGTTGTASWTAAVPAVDLTGTVAGSQIADGAIVTTKISDGAISALKLADSSVTTTKLVDDSVITSKIAANAVTVSELADGAVSSAKIADAAISTAKFASSIKPIEVLSSLPVTGLVAGRTVFLTTDNKLYRYTGSAWVSSVAASDVSGQLTVAQIQDGAITTVKLSDTAVTAAKIADAVISNAKLASGLAAVESVASLPSTGNFQGRTVMLQSDGKLYRWNSTGTTGTTSWTAAVPAVDLTGTVAGSQIADNAISVSKIVDGAIASAKLADSAVTTAKIGDGALTAIKFASGTRPVEVLSSLPSSGNTAGRTVFLTTDNKLYRYTGSAWTSAVPAVDLTGQITSTQITDDAVTTAKIAANAVTAAEIAANTITAAQIAAGTITANQISAGTITAGLIATNAITASKLFVGDAVNFCQDPMFTDPAYWSGYVANTTDTTALASLGVAAAFKSVNGNGSTSQADYAISMPSSQNFTIEGGASYRLNFAWYVTSGHTGMAALRVYWYKPDGSAASTSNSSVYSTDYRTVAASTAVGSSATGIVTAPADAVYARLQLRTLWSSTLNNAGNSYIGYPVMNRATSGELIVDGAITASKIAASAITAGKIAAGTIQAADIAANTITGAKIAADTITATNIAAGTITASEIASNAITAVKIAAGTITSDKIAANTITAAQIAAGTITAAEIAVGTITASKLAITGENLWPDPYVQDINWWKGNGQGSVNNPGYVNPTNATNVHSGGWVAITNNSNLSYRVGGGRGYWQLWSGDAGTTGYTSSALTQVVAPSMWAKASTSYELMLGVTNSSNKPLRVMVQYYDADGAYINGVNVFTVPAGDATTIIFRGQYTTPANAVTTRLYWEVQAGVAFSGFVCVGNISVREAATGTMVVDGSISASKIEAAAITTDKLAANAVTASKIAANTITAAEIATGAITADELSAGAITAGKIAAGAIGATEISANAITAKQLVISDFSNLFLNPNFAGGSVAGWNGVGSTVLRSSQSWFADMPSEYLGQMTSSSTVPTANTDIFSVIAGETYYTEMWVTGPAATAGLTVLAYARRYDASNPSGSPITMGTATMMDKVAVKITGSYTVPAGTDRLAVGLRLNNTTGTTVTIYVTGFVMRRMASGELIVDGAITAQKVAANAISAAKIAAGTITANEIASGAITTSKISASAVTANEIATNAITAAKIQAGSITGDRLAVNSVTASRITVSDVTNYALDPNFTDAAYWSLSGGAFNTTDTSVLTTMAVSSAFKVSGNGTTNQSDSAANSQKFDVEGGGTFRVSYTWLVTNGFTGVMYFRVYWYDRVGNTISNSTPSGYTDFRATGAAVGQQSGTVTAMISAPANACQGLVSIRAGWSGNYSNGGTGYIGYPILQRAANSELIVDGAVSAAKVAANAITAVKIAANAITADKIAANTITSAQIAADTITAGNIASSAITAAKVAAGAILASKLFVGDTSNMVTDSDMVDVDSWNGSTVTSVAASGSWASRNYLRAASSSAYLEFGSKAIPVEPSKPYFFSGYVRGTAASTTNIYLNWYSNVDLTGYISSSLVLTNTTGTGWVKGSGIFTAPANARVVSIRYTKSSGTSGLDAIEPIIRRAANGELIVDGAITADKVAANAISADKIAANAITADKITSNAITTDKIAADTITGVKIAADSITAKQLLLYDFSNIVDLGFSKGSLDGWSLQSLQAYLLDTGAGSAAGWRIQSNGRDQAISTLISVTPGESYYLEVWVYNTDATRANLYTFGYADLNLNGSVLSIVNYTDAKNSWTRLQGTYTIPSGVRALRMCLQTDRSTPGTGGSTYWTKPVMRRAANAEMIVDGAISAIKIAANSITAAQIQSNTITASQIAAGAITASRLAIGDTSNIFPDPLMTDSALWADIGSYTFVTTSFSYASARRLQSPLNTSEHDAYSSFFSVEPSKPYYASCAAFIETGSTSGEFYVNFYSQTDGGTGIGSYLIGTTTSTSPANRISGIVTAPSNARSARFGWRKNASASNARASFAEPVLRRAANGELIVDGAISADKIAANTITADKIAANTLTAAQIQSGTITSTQIAAGAITASRLSISGENLWPDPYVQDLSWWKGPGKGSYTSPGYVNPSNDSNVSSSGWVMVTDNGAFSYRVGGGRGYWQLWSGDAGTTGYTSTATAQVVAPSLWARPGASYELMLGAFNVANKNLSVVVQYFDHTGAYLSGQVVMTVPAGDSSTVVYRTQYTVPTNAVTVRLYWEVASGAAFSGFICVGNISVKEAATGTMVVDGTISAAKIAANSITASKIAAGSITASRLLLGDTSNMVPDPDMADISSWNGSAVTSSNAVGPYTSKYFLSSTATTAAVDFGTAPISVEPNKPYFVSAGVRASTGSNPTFVYINWYSDADMTVYVSSSYVGTNASTSFNTLLSGVFTAPANARTASIRFTKGSSANFAVQAISPIFRRATSGELIVDGAITADKIAANAITAGKIAADSITSAQIASNSITAKQLLLYDFSNIVDLGFSKGDLSGWTMSGLLDYSLDTAGSSAGWRIQSNGRDQALSSVISVTPGEAYYLEAWVYNTDSTRAALYVASSTSLQAGISAWYTAAYTDVKNSWVRIQGIFTVPAGITAVRMLLHTDRTAFVGSSTYWSKPVMRRAANAELIVDGAITADKIAANSINATKIAAGSITATQIQTGTITSTQIATGTIIASKMAIGDTSNMYPDPELYDSTLLESSSVSIGPLNGANLASRNWAYTANTTAAVDVRSSHITVEPGKPYYVATWMGVNTGSTSVLFYIEWWNINSSGNYAYAGASAVSSTTSSIFASGIVTPPSNATRARFLWRKNASSGASQMVLAQPVMRRASNGELIVDGSITADKIAANAITAGKIAAGSIQAVDIAAGTITGDKIYAKTLTSTQIAASAITSTELAANSVSAVKIQAGAIDASKIQANSITAGQIQAATITGTEIAANSITAKQLVLVDFSNIADNGYSKGQLDGWQLDRLLGYGNDTGAGDAAGWRIESNGRDQALSSVIAVTPGEAYYMEVWVYNTDASRAHILAFGYADLNFTGGVIAPIAHTDAKHSWTRLQGTYTVPSGVRALRMGLQTERTSGVGSSTFWSKPVMRRAANAEMIVDGSISAVKIAANSISAANIQAGAITTDKILAGAIESSLIATQAITAEKLAVGSVTTLAMTAGSINADRLTAGTITAGLLAANSVQAVNLQANSVTAEKMNVTSLAAITATIGTLRTATSGARMEIRDNVIKVYDSAGTLRVQIGDLSL